MPFATDHGHPAPAGPGIDTNLSLDDIAADNMREPGY